MAEAVINLTTVRPKNGANPFVTAQDISVRGVDLFYGDAQALKNINLFIERNKVTALIGPSGCGKSTLLRCLNRMNDEIKGCAIHGSFTIGDTDLYREVNVNLLRKNIGMVFQKPNVFPMSIFDNMTYGPKTYGVHDKAELARIAEECLVKANLWDEVKDRLKESALSLSGGQQQRLCIARCLSINPRVILMDFDGEDRTAGRRTQKRLHHRHRHAQHAAGDARGGQDGVLPFGRSYRIRRYRPDLQRSARGRDQALHQRRVQLIKTSFLLHLPPHI